MLGIEKALGRPVDIAVNHDPEAVAMHRLNHPATIHHLQDVWSVDPAEISRRGPISLAWLSPDCTPFSVAKGAAPIRMCGNSVCPDVAEALVSANVRPQFLSHAT